MLRLVWIFSARWLIHILFIAYFEKCCLGLVYASERQGSIQDAMATVYRPSGQWYINIFQYLLAGFLYHVVVLVLIFLACDAIKYHMFSCYCIGLCSH